ncbi:Phox-associated domain,Sorting nexin [Thalictrum thalictroides]|uniref:Phox-associated domain,Sorting nexin n=1 Tax=Thalictrum thalictroides TaxID=46969 RepID=A0A7J6V604_THATH|nr:Phox-associated domain,Sorting nexin [Thalictrum thalictroides]
MSTGRQTVRDLIEEAKKRMVLLVVCVIGLSYLMSLTSSSVWINLPVAASLIFLLRYISVDLDMKRKAAAYNNSPTISRILKQPQEGLKVGSVDNSNWRRKVNSPIVEAAIDHFANHLITEWVTDLWYSKLTPDKDGPEELVQIINNVLGEISCRAKEINLIDLLTRDVINVICSQLELSRISQAKIEEQSGNLSIDQRDAKLKLVLAAENKLHPALFSPQSEHRVLQHLMEGLISFTFKPADLQCSFFRYIVRELLACAVIRPVLNLPNPRFINEKIESLVISRKAEKGVTSSEQEPCRQKPHGSSKASDNLSRFLDQSLKGVELVQFQHDKELGKASVNGKTFQKDPLLCDDPQSSCSLNSYPSHSQVDGGKDLQRHHSGGEWGQMLDIMSHKKTQALAPENFENMWTKGRNYRKKERDTQSTKQAANILLNGNHGTGNHVDHSKGSSKHTMKNKTTDIVISKRDSLLPQQENKSKEEGFRVHTDGSSLVHHPDRIYEEENEHDLVCLNEAESDNDSSYTTDDDETSGVTGLDSPGTKVWDSKNNRQAAVSHIRHPLESSEGHMAKKIGKGHVKYRKAPRTQLARRRSKLSSERVPTWQEVERTSFLLGDGHDILNASKGDLKAEESSDEPEIEIWSRARSGAGASSSASTIPVSDIRSSSLNSAAENSVLEDSFLTLRCEVLGANIVKSGSKTFAVYSISVTDVDNKSWSIKRRFRHFEELHRRLKEFPEYKLCLPPKHFLSSGLDVTVIQERCHLLDKYLKVRGQF